MPDPGPRPSLRACVFTVGGKPLAADIRHTREIVVLPDPTPVPRAPAHVLGVANLRGHVVPIVDIGPVLGLPPRPAGDGAGPRTIVLEDAGIAVAVALDEVLGLESFDDVLPMDEAGAGRNERLAQGLLQRADGVAMLLDVAGLVEAVRVRPPSRPDA